MPPPTSGTSATTAARLRARAAAARRRRARDRARTGSRRSRSTSSRRRARGASGSRLPGLYNVYNALAAAALSRVRSARPSTRSQAGLERSAPAFGRFERIDVGDRRLLLLLIKNPAGANEVVRTLVARRRRRGSPSIALNDEIADGRDVSWIWDVDFEPLLDGLERVVVTGGARGRARAALHVRRASPRSAIEVVPELERALDRGLAADAAGRRARRPPHLHGDARAAADRRRARPRARQYWERAA